MSDDSKLSQRYRELPREEPPRALDDAILAASRRAVEARPAPLVVPTGRRRWYFPVAAAAVIVLAVAVVVHVEREQPDTEILAPSTTVLETPPAPAAQEPKVEEPKAEAPKRLRKQASPGFTPDPRADSAASAPAAPAPAAPPAAQAERNEAMGAVAGARESSRDERRSAQMARSSVAPSPEAELERIARLRAAGRHEEADKALAEFRKRYPDYRLSEETKAKVEKPQ
ncbi:MAG: hypothetical protein QOD26_608 [Betaproteobacteria bacterium]|jgi:hypothetical protein|nr:hypothetical protein [Betaproteobacteria bacterium]